MAAPARRVLYVSSNCYLDDSNGATVASRAMMESLARAGFTTEVLTGSLLETNESFELSGWLTRRGFKFEVEGGGSWTASPRGLRCDIPTHYRLAVQGVPITLCPDFAVVSNEADSPGVEAFLRLFGNALGRFRPDVVVNFGGDAVAHEVRARARAGGAAVVFALHNFSYRSVGSFNAVDAVFVPSHFASDHYREMLELNCTVLPNLIDRHRVLAEIHEARYVTFVNPSYEKGVYVFARIADELGRRRPDIPLLVVEGRGSERTLADCGVDLRVHGNVNLMGHTPDPRQFWGVTRICLMPSLWWENQPLAAVEAMINGIPVIGSDRGGIPETLGESGVVLALPERLTAATRVLPTVEEVAPWVEAIIRLWDDQEFYAEQSRLALEEARRWAAEVLEPLYVKFFHEIRAGGRGAAAIEEFQ